MTDFWGLKEEHRLFAISMQICGIKGEKNINTHFQITGTGGTQLQSDVPVTAWGLQ